ncbi:MAG TPA: hypothetical protein VHA80_11460 [Solirubrobacterales bacterium]|nr:hypothetical protein [Solirubrobacterales bacterium]
MALSDEQNAMLRLLARGEQGYADIAALMGLSEDEVRAKVVGALAQLQAEGKPAPDIPPPIPGGAHPAAEVTAPEPEARAAGAEPAEPAIADASAPGGSATEPADAKPAGAAPESAADAEHPGRGAARPPAAAPTAGAGPAPSPGSGPSKPVATSGGRTITLPTGRRAWLLGGGAVAAVVAIVVVILLVSGGGGGGSTTATTAGTRSAAEGGNGEANAGAKPATEAKLEPVGGSGAEGFASFGRVKNKLALQVEATGLQATEEGVNSYAIWLAQNPRKMIPLASVGVKGSGKAAGVIAARFEVPLEVLGYLASGTFDQIAITKVDNKRFEAGIKVATKRKSTPTYLGEEVLRGTITGPIVGLAVREEEEDEEEEEEKKAEDAGE